MNWTVDDYKFMARAMELARQGLYTSHPNPRVGCVLVRDNVIVGEGSHIQTGKEHAEINAIKQAGDKAKGATCYVTLEPCVHTGKTPPCTTGLLSAGIKSVIASMVDPNPLVNGKGLECLAKNGIKTYTGLLDKQAEAINIGYIKRQKYGVPHIRCKMAVSADGKTALKTGESKWITGPEARADVQYLRAESGAIMSGIGTVIADDPRLTVRDLDLQGRLPFRVIIDETLSIPLGAELFKQPGKIIIYTTAKNDEKINMLKEMEVDVVIIENNNKYLLSSMQSLARDYQVNSVLIESGAKLAGAMLDENLIDEFIIYQAPVFFGSNAMPMVQIKDVMEMENKISLVLKDSRQIGQDLRLQYQVEKKVEGI